MDLLKSDQYRTHALPTWRRSILATAHVVVILRASSAANRPGRGAVVTITEIKAGTGALNTIPTQAVMPGPRAFSPDRA
jgi:metal-dependent amidase/aminoacylase/carboxypeptidase family protein